MEYELSSLKDLKFSSLKINTEIFNIETGKTGTITDLIEHEQYPVVIIKWEDEEYTHPFHFNMSQIFLYSDIM